MLSAIMKHVQSIAIEPRLEFRKHLINLAVSSYPDLRPWQVRNACLVGTKQDPVLAELFYYYLSFLLHPSEGFESAKHDEDLVRVSFWIAFVSLISLFTEHTTQEWCELSIEPSTEGQRMLWAPAKSPNRRDNFYRIAKRSWPDHRLYHRDLVMLMDLSRKSDENDIVLDLIDEFLDQVLAKENILRALEYLRVVAEKSLNIDNDKCQINIDRMKKVSQLVEKMAGVRHSDVVVAYEVHKLLRKCSHPNGHTQKEGNLMALLSNQLNPVNALDTFALWSPANESAPVIFPCLLNTLKRSTQLGVHSEISGSLLRINRERQKRLERQKPFQSGAAMNSPVVNDFMASGSLWQRMLKGTLVIEK